MHTSFSDSQSAYDLVSVVSRQLDGLIESHISTLLAAEAAKHDHITGIIKGLKTAKRELEATGKKWRAGVDLEDADPRQHRLAAI